jgi:MoaA/NifB/PqqE/SkfB family radical SAM enzyme
MSAFPRARQLLSRLSLRKSPAIPLFQRVVIELQSHCNRKCYFCCRESDTSGKRKTADGRSVLQFMPSERVTMLFDELGSMRFRGYITFHHLSEAFLDRRLIGIARDARSRGMRPYVHTNGDVLRNDEALCREAAEVFEYIVVGLYDYQTEEEKQREKEFWKKRLKGTKVMFSLAEKIYVRTHSPRNSQMNAIVRQTHPNAVCAQPQTYLMIHYNGDVACCCEDMYGDLLRMNIFENSIREVWYSERHASLIKALQAGGRKQFVLCRKCTMGPSHYSSNPMQATDHYDR